MLKAIGIGIGAISALVYGYWIYFNVKYGDEQDRWK